MAVTIATVRRLIRLGGQSCTIEAALPTLEIDEYNQVVLAPFAPYALYGDGRLVVPCYLYETQVSAYLRDRGGDTPVADYELYLEGNPPMIDAPDSWQITNVIQTKGGASVNLGPLPVVGISRPAPVVTILKLKRS